MLSRKHARRRASRAFGSVITATRRVSPRVLRVLFRPRRPRPSGARGSANLFVCLGVSAALAIAAGAAGSAPSFGRAQNYATGPGPTSLAIGDMNGDHKPDLATANGDATSVSVLLNKGRGRFEARRDYPTGGGPLSVAIADLNADGKPDLATANSGAETVSVLLNKGDGSFWRSATTHAERGPFPWRAATWTAMARPILRPRTAM